jgi:hypothetical protein
MNGCEKGGGSVSPRFQLPLSSEIKALSHRPVGRPNERYLLRERCRSRPPISVLIDSDVEQFYEMPYF